MNFYTDLKAKTNILEVAKELGFRGQQSGAVWQGDCPNHSSAKGRCLTIWPRTQTFHCFHCGVHGDVIDLVGLLKSFDLRQATNFLADRCGMPRREAKNLSLEEKAKRAADQEEQRLVQNMLTEAARWYHGQLKNHLKIMNAFQKHYGFSEEIIAEHLIGFAPPSGNGLSLHLNAMPEFTGKLHLSSLVNFTNPKGPYRDYFCGRIIFPYFQNGKVVYIKGRVIPGVTPANKFECYADKAGNIKKDSSGAPDFIKYKALRSHDPEHETRKYISRFVQNTIMGEDSIRGAKEIIITEGAPDLISALDHGFAAISPVTTHFSAKDLEKLAALTKQAAAVYLINDSEDNRAGLEGALKTGIFLTKAGRQVYLVELPRPGNVSKIDLNEYLKDHTADDLRELLQKAKPVLEVLINQLPEDFLKALPKLQADICPILAHLEPGTLEHYLEVLRKHTKTTKKAIASKVEEAKKKLSEEKKAPHKPLDPEVAQRAQALIQDPLVYKKRLDVINQAGVVGERTIMAMYLAALDSRLLPEDPASPNALALKNSGHYGSGKSFSLAHCLTIYPETGYYLISSGSTKSLYYLKNGLKNKALVVTEGFQFQQANAEDSEMVYVVRSLLSEGRIRYLTVEKDKEGKLATVEKTLEGPTSFITTTVMERLEDQLEDRLFTIHPDETMGQTRDILAVTAQRAAGLMPGLDDKTVNTWKAFHESLKPV